jgi:hypothetical protein
MESKRLVKVCLIPTAEQERLIEAGEGREKCREGLGKFNRTYRTFHLANKSYHRIRRGHWSGGQWECQEEPGNIFLLLRQRYL